MKQVAFYALLTCFILAGCSGNSSKPVKETNQNKSITYTCTMHPEVNADKPGKCPKCDMELVEKKD